MYAAEKGYYKIVSMLLKYDRDTVRDAHGMNAYMYACRYNHRKVINLLNTNKC
jgi:ankyrin repeat protein